MPDVCSNQTLGQGVSLVTNTKLIRSTGQVGPARMEQEGSSLGYS